MMDPELEQMAEDVEGVEAPNPEMDEYQILSIIKQEMAGTIGWSETTAEERRANLLRRYLGEKYGNEQEGYSQAISRDVYEVVEWALPQLVETFLAGDQVARFDPVGPEDEDEAMQQTDIANHVFLKENDGFLVLSTAIKDALIQEIGIVYWYWKQEIRTEYEVYEGLTEEQVTMNVEANPELEITGAIPREVEPGVILYDVEVRRSFDGGRLCIEAIPPEEFFYSPDARSINDARAVGRQRTITASEMIDLGYDHELVADLSGEGGIATTSGELARASRDEGGAYSERNNRQDAEREIDLIELWIRIDVDGDGIAELRRCVLAGKRGTIHKLISCETATRKPFAVASPIMMPHRLAGISLAETVEDIAEIRTAILRAYLNGLYLSQRPRSIVLGDALNGPLADTEEMQSVVPGGWITEYQPGAIRPYFETDVTAQSITGLELMKGMREERTGITRTWQGIEAPNALNDTAHGMQMLSNAAGKRLAFIARLIAEGMVKPLFTGIAAEVKQHQRIPKVVRLRGQWHTVDPTDWRNEYDATVEVGLGYGDREQAVFGIQQIAALQEKLASFGLTQDMVTREKVWETVREVCKQFGFKNASRFFEDPSGKPEPEDPGPTLDEQKLVQERELKMRELEVRELDIRLTHEREMAKIGILTVAPQPDPVPGVMPSPMPQAMPPDVGPPMPGAGMPPMLPPGVMQ